MTDELSGAVTNFLANKIKSTDPDFEEYLIDIANIFSEFDGQAYDYEDVTHRFLVLSDRTTETVRDPSGFRDMFGAYMFFLVITRVVAENDKWLWRLTNAASKLLCAEEPNVRAFIRVQLSLFQYPLLAGGVYKNSKVRPINVAIQGKNRDKLIELINAQIKVVTLRLILRALHVKSKDLKVSIIDVCLSNKDVYFLFNHPLTSTHPNPTEDNIQQVLARSEVNSLPVSLNFYRNFHIFEHTGILKRVKTRTKGAEFNLAVNLDSDVESSELKWHIIKTIMSMDNFCNDFYERASHEPLEEHLKQIALASKWTNYYDGGLLPENIYSSLVGESMGTVQKTEEKAQLTPSPPNQLSTEQVGTAPPLRLKEHHGSASRLYKSISHTADPEVTRLKLEKSNTYHRHLVDLVNRKLLAQCCQLQESLYIDLASTLEGIHLLFEMKSCNRQNLTSQVRKAVSQVYEYRYRYRDNFPEDSSVLCIVLQEAPDRWWINYLVEDRKINVMWLEGEINLACTANCHPLIKRLVDDYSYA